MYILNELALAVQDDNLRIAARRRMSSRAHAARRGGPARPAVGMRVLRGHRAAQAY